LHSLKQIRITLVEKRSEDAWFDLNTRQLRKGEVKFYRAKDPATGEWLFKTCIDKQLEKILVKALKCPRGFQFAQLEGNSMLFQKSKIPNMFYDIISLTETDGEGRIKRKTVSTLEEIPAHIRENYQVKTYEEAVGKTAPGKHFVTLCRSEDEKSMIALFIIERAWPITPISAEDKLKTLQEKEEKPPTSFKKEIDIGQVWKCPICNIEHRIIHIETEKTIKHALRKKKINENPS